MLNSRLTVILTKQQKEALRILAAGEFRDYRQQAAIIIRDELERRGLLTEQSVNATKAQTNPRGANVSQT